MSPSTRIILFNFWEYVAFLANSLVFLLIGLQVNVPDLIGAWQPALVGVAAVLVSRMVVVYGFSWIANRFAEPVPVRWQHVMAWGGLRGALSLALALSLPASFGADRDLLRIMAFAVVLFTLLGQGMTMEVLLRWLGIIVRPATQLAYEIHHGRLASLRSAERHLERQYHEGLLSTHSWQALKTEMDERAHSMSAALHELLQAEPALAETEVAIARRELLRAQRSALMNLHHGGVISDEALNELASEVDSAIVGKSGEQASPGTH